jgi:hypothetical protein
MVAKGNPLENPVAERINGTIKMISFSIIKFKIFLRPEEIFRRLSGFITMNGHIQVSKI